MRQCSSAGPPSRLSVSAPHASASGRWWAAISTASQHCSQKSPRPSTSSAADASTGASERDGTRTSVVVTATTFRYRKSASRCCVSAWRSSSRCGQRRKRRTTASTTRSCAATATRSRCKSRVHRSGLVAAASSSRCVSSRGTPTMQTLVAQSKISNVSAKSSPNTAKTSDETSTRFDSRGHPKSSCARLKPKWLRPGRAASGVTRSSNGRPSRSWALPNK